MSATSEGRSGAGFRSNEPDLGTEPAMAEALPLGRVDQPIDVGGSCLGPLPKHEAASKNAAAELELFRILSQLPRRGH